MKRPEFLKALLALPLLSLFSFKHRDVISIKNFIESRGFIMKWEDTERLCFDHKPVRFYELPRSMPQNIVRYSYSIFVYKKHPRILIQKDQGYYAQLGGIFDGKVDNVEDLKLIFKCLGL